MIRYAARAAALLALLAGAAGAAAPLEPFEARFDVSRNGKLAGEARVALIRLDAERWEWTTRTRGTRGIAALANLEIDERSVFRWRDGRPELVESSYDQRAAWTSRRRSLRVDLPTKTIAAYDGKRLHTLAFEPYTIDLHLSTLALMTGLARGEPQLEFRVATRDRVEPHRYARGTGGVVETAAGVVETVHVRRLRKDEARSSAFWFAPSLGWLPVRVAYSDSKGERIELRLAAGPRPAR